MTLNTEYNTTPKKQRVLLVDDDREILRGLSVRLRAFGFEILTAVNGKTGLEAAAANRPNLILLDINMPVMDGFTMLSRLRRSDDMKETPVMMLSANVSGKIKQEALNRGAQFFLEKPYDPVKLITMLKSAIRQAPARAHESCVA